MKPQNRSRLDPIVRMFAAAGVAVALSACSLAPPKATGASIRLNLDIVSGAWTSATTSTGRFLTPETTQVFIDVRKGSDTGAVVAQSTLSVTLNSAIEATASGEVLNLPVGESLFFTAEIRDAPGTAISRASAALTLDGKSTPVVSLVLLPLASNPLLTDLAEGASSVTVNAGASQILRFSPSLSPAVLRWAFSSYPDLVYQMRNSDGKTVTTQTVGSPTAEIQATVPTSGFTYLIVYNKGASAFTVAMDLTTSTSDVVILAEGPNSVTIPAGETRILKFNATSSPALLKWAVSSYPNLSYTVRDGSGNVLPTGALLAPNSGVQVNVSTSGPTYYWAANTGSTTLTLPLVVDTTPLIVALDASGNAYASHDAVTWSSAASTGLTTAVLVRYGSGRFVAVGVTGSSNFGLSTSSDGSTWSVQNLAGNSAYLNGLEVNGSGQFLAVGTAGATGQSFTSNDGLTWNGPYTTPISGGSVGPALVGTSWIIASTNLSSLKTSSDGSSWTSLAATSSLYSATTLFGVNGYLIAGGGAPSSAAKETVTSPTGGTGTFNTMVTVDSSVNSGYVYALAGNSNGRVLAVGGSVNPIFYSDDYGATWTASSGYGSNAFNAACSWRKGFLAADATGALYGSSDGASFNLLSSVGTAAIKTMAAK